jgi:hypothetical protein
MSRVFKIILILCNVIAIGILYGADYFTSKALNEVFEFEQTILDDNLKNQVVLEGHTYILYGLEGRGYINKDKRFPVYAAVYVEDVTLEELVNEARLLAIKKRNEFLGSK